MMETQAEARDAIDRVIASARLHLRIFDEDPTRLRERGFAAPARIDALRQFLLGGRHRTFTLVLHETRSIESELPRLVTLIGQFSAQVSIRRTVGQGREAHDPMAIADDHSFWHKLHVDHPRSVASLSHPKDAQPLMDRFGELVDSSEIATAGTR
ncbi:MAG: hypothetical protein JNJ55_10200, partial [Betaproteobacteria bacterium]|nr:hypothetical protein [Betaproteobacteria bacterium]